MTSCVKREVAENVPDPGPQADVYLPVNLNRNIDILFVVDDSGSMAAEQASLKTNFPKFIERLATIPGGLPNVRLGVTTTSITGSGCGNAGQSDKDGRLQNTTGSGAGDATCPSGVVTTDNANFLIHTSDDDGNVINHNYAGAAGAANLAKAFGCMAAVGVNGCGFEQPFEAARKALENNPDFIRNGQNGEPDALLAVIFITDEDDCSVTDLGLFANATSGLDNHRCFENGIVCKGDNQNAGVKEECRSREDDQFITPVQEYATFFREFKSNPRSVIVASISGETVDSVTGESLVEVIDAVDNDNNPGKDLKKQCSDGTPLSGADPGVRILELLNQFPGRNTFQTICDADLSDALSQIAELLAIAAGSPCLQGPLSDTDDATAGIQPECIVEFQPDAPGAEANQIPRCSSTTPAPTELPCWFFETDTTCASETDLKINIERASGQNNQEGSDRVTCLLD